MQKLSLTKEVLISGSNLFGRPAYLRLTPCSEPGWYWDVGTNIVPINRKLVRIKKNRVVLQYQASRLNVVEHILPLRWTGLDGVIIEASAWPPYFGGMLGLWQAIEPNLTTTNQQIPWLKIIEEKSVSTGKRSIRWASNKTPGLKIKIAVDFPKFGCLTKRFQLPDQNLINYFPARPLAVNSHNNFWPALSRAVTKTGLWPHHNCLAWPTERPVPELLDELVNHRLLDLLGALAMIDHCRLPTGRVISVRGGHALDVQLITKNPVT
ncbi:hypothetical protein EOM71_03295 [Candidatus Falkowbacteria bacterium]|nr:hypothetical protein [Candidatus Falkowbacteria bacterium]